MYVIYVNDRPLTLLSTEELRTCDPAQFALGPNTHLTANYTGKPRTILQYTDMLEKGSPKVTSVTLVAHDLERMWEDFRGKHKWVAAAGGLVRNTELDRYLFIFRRGHWDLPKGKIDAGETPSMAALREVKEETGVSDLRLGAQLPTTYHTYRNRKGKRVLKPTYWFSMETVHETLTPQKEEDIELASWKTREEVSLLAKRLYRSLHDLLAWL